MSSSELVRPPITTVPSDRFDAEPGSSASASGSMPAIIETVVITIGRKRSRAACGSPSTLSSPRSTLRIAKSTSRIPFLLTSPTSMTTPMSENRLRLWWVSASAPSAPTAATGTRT